ncbi:MAG: circularly permuted type 2 ATP-grasp protein, partial [Actinomycetota bacterium]|nr:circularly permuted type 2 ATP-grasp protein [Actinomycetota bacterium]
LEVTFGPDEPYSVDPVPRVIGRQEWKLVADGLGQRLRAVVAFLEDSYTGREAVAAGVIPGRVLDDSLYFEPLAGEADAFRRGALIAGPDLIRSPSGELLVVEDNLRTPSGMAYALAARDAVTSNPDLPVPSIADPSDAIEQFGKLFRTADPSASDDPGVAILSDGPDSKAWFEHREMAKRIRVPIVTPDQLRVDEGILFADHGKGAGRIDVLYNRSSQESLRDREGNLSPLGKVLAGPLDEGRLSCVNPFGSGLADDKAVHCYMDRLITFYLYEEPLLRSVPGFDLGDPEHLQTALERLDELVIKPRFSFGGQGIVLGPRSTTDELDTIRERVAASPADFVAQELVDFSVHPTACGDGFEQRRVDLRAYVMSGPAGTGTLPLALTRFAGEPGELVVNSTQGGGCKDTWILS